MNENALIEGLTRGAHELGVSLDARSTARLGEFIRLLEKWNRSFNLTGTRSVSELLHAHVLDSLCLHALLPNGAVLDVGTGAGFPGIPLAICDEQRKFVLLDSNGKKTRFLHQAKTELGLQNVMIRQARMEDYRPEQAYPCIVSRAVASTYELGDALRPILEPDGQLLLMKGSEYPEELEAMPSEFSLQAVKTFAVPGKELQRHVLILRKSAASEQASSIRRSQQSSEIR